jgi:hypothetical protein
MGKKARQIQVVGHVGGYMRHVETHFHLAYPAGRKLFPSNRQYFVRSAVAEVDSFVNTGYGS